MTASTLRAITLGSPGEDIGRKDLAAIVRRFQNLHRLQLQRIQEHQTPRQRDFLDLLPLLFHCNHPMLPGYVSSETPAGIPDYLPSRRALLAVKRLTKSFEYKRRALTEYPIHAVYLMGSVGSVAYSRKSDLDIWLCCSGALDEIQLDELRRKAAGVEKWAQSLGLEAHIFFIDTDRFRLGIGTPISSESCGSVQHHLLLEEFYRTSVWLAGRAMAWWLVPPDQEDRYGEYLNHLREKRFVNENDLIDFGGLEYIPLDEFLGGTLWHLHKAIDAPHKSLLKLFLMESYASQYPRIRWLCTRLKAAVYEGNLDAGELDPYILMYRDVEQYLSERGESERLELVRQCFYLKLTELARFRGAAEAEKRRRQDILQAMIHAWGWPSQRIRELDERRHWKVIKALRGQKVIGRELTRSYHAVRQFALEHAKIGGPAGEEIKLLGRRLSAALELKPGKVEKLSLDSSDRIEPEDFSVHEMRLADGEMGWILYPGRVGPADAEKAQYLKKARSLIELLAWLSLNGLYDRSANLFLETVESALTPLELKNSFHALNGFLASHHSEPEHLDDYGRMPRVIAAALFVNLGVDVDADRRDGFRLASSRHDALSYGHERTNLVHQVDAIVLTSWRETLVQRYQGLTGFLDCLADLINESFSEESRVECFCFVAGRARTIALRVKELYQDLRAAFLGSDKSFRYILRGGQEFYLFDKQGTGVRFWGVPDVDSLYAELSAPRPMFSPVIFDRAALDNDPLPFICQYNRPGVIQVFCQPESGQVRVYILDERGSLFYRIHEPVGPQLLLGPYVSFLNAILQRYVLAAGGLEYHLVEHHASGGYSVKSAGFQPNPVSRMLEIRVFAQETASGRAAYTIFCNDSEFSSMDAGQDVFSMAAAHIMRLRQSGERYPIYITDIDVPLSLLGVDTPEALQTIHFLNFKRKIEERLNA
ncbi:class I adenylate cyclase [Methylocaldum sp.]|uniref:class I adenylate cyclase n=1 Tax=Methylocaldum sp. TaxID=1969727 RepID=UPI002D46436F|nr:class I adenylate cyclase [Methylocaldum sp.]HYE34683.1 class I adenylate cyclase [Methylocaldum sp.]